MELKPEPTVKMIVQLFDQVLRNEVAREEVADFAMHFITNDTYYDIRDKYVLSLLELASGIDLKDSPTDYLHNEEDIMEWINTYKEK